MDVFISYRRTAAVWAESIRDRLTEKNVDAFLDTHEIKNDDFFEMIEWNIEESPNFLLILSPDSFREQNDQVDYYRWEIEQAIKKGKNLIVIKVEDFDESKVDWSKENEYISRLKTFNNNKYSTDTQKHDIENIISLMRDENGYQWRYVPQDNSNWYATHKITEKDVLWMRKNFEVCKRMDNNLFKIMYDSDEWIDSFEDRDKLNYFTLDLYDKNTILDKIKSSKENDKYIPIEAYGFCHDMENLEGKNTLLDCDELFGKNHFIDCCKESNYEEGLKKIFELNNIQYFDIIECTLVLKDCQNPNKVLSLLQSYLNPKGGFIFIRELDDDLIAFYPDDNGYMSEMKKMLRKDPAAGNRFLGKEIYTRLQESGAKEIYISDEVVSTANCINAEERIDICNAYFSYLEPEFLALTHDNPRNIRYKKCYEFIRDNYESVLNLFRSSNFYFRAGYICGYGFYKQRRRR